MSALLQTPIAQLDGIGPKLTEKLAKLGIERVADLLFHLPLRYQDRTRLTPVGQLRPGQEALVQGVVCGSRIVYGRKRSLLCTIEDDSGQLQLRFFHFAAAMQKQLLAGRPIRCFGELRSGPQGLEMIHPEYRLDADPQAAAADALTPVYPGTEGVSQQLWRKLQQQALDLLRRSDESLALASLPDHLHWLDVPLKQALVYLHQPPADADLAAIQQGHHPYQQRLAFEELLAHQLSLLQLRARRRQYNAPACAADNPLGRQLAAQLPFALTRAQQRVVADISADLAGNTPMLRLVQGDVGSGKTVVAAIAAAQAVAAGFQVAIMAPTEILAEQHQLSFQQWFAPLAIQVGWLVGKHSKTQKQQIIDQLADGTIQIVLGTHAMFQQGVEFQRLGLVIIDEQHRFGVHQRLALRDKGADGSRVPHQLIMTATPIPRTLAMTAYADLDLSVIDELPPGRTPVNTIAIEQHRRDQVIARIHAACRQRQQAYWVCTLIEESETLNCQAAEKTAERLQQELTGLRVGLVHGRLKAQEKAATMAAFAAGDIDVLVATTVIEVGVNVPNASLMVIENPERLGLAQLHQLRGRVGRGAVASHCVLLYQMPLSQAARARLNILRQTNDGFAIAETDLSLRGPGEVLGSRQTGLLQFRIADVDRDHELLAAVHDYAPTFFRQQRGQVDALIQRWINKADYYAQG